MPRDSFPLPPQIRGLNQLNGVCQLPTEQIGLENAMDPRDEKGAAGKGLLLWMVGVPLPVILILWMLGYLN